MDTYSSEQAVSKGLPVPAASTPHATAAYAYAATVVGANFKRFCAGSAHGFRGGSAHGFRAGSAHGFRAGSAHGLPGSGAAAACTAGMAGAISIEESSFSFEESRFPKNRSAVEALRAAQVSFQ